MSIKVFWSGRHDVEVEDAFSLLGGDPKQACLGVHGFFPLYRTAPEAAGAAVGARAIRMIGLCGKSWRSLWVEFLRLWFVPW